MTPCDVFGARLAGYLEDAIDPTSREECAAHLARCARCAALVADLRAIVAQAGSLPVVAPSRDLWGGVAARLDRVVSLPSGPVATRNHRFVRRAAAAAAVIVGAVGVTYVGSGRSSAHRVAAPRHSAPDVQPAYVIGAPPGATPYDADVAALRLALASRRSRLDPQTVAVIDRSLRQIDRAIAESRAALARDTASGFLGRQLTAALESEMRLLRTAVLLPTQI